MFCMYCGQTLPDGAKFCKYCGTPQDAVAPISAPNLETINLNGAHTFVPAMCPNCSAHMNVDSSNKIARCDNCGTECLVQDAIQALNVMGNVQVGNATINVNGTNTESLLQRVEIMLADSDFSGAMSKCDTILDSDPTNGRVYFYMLMSDLRCKNRNDLANQPIPFDGNQYYARAIQYGDESLKSELIGYIEKIKADQKELGENLKGLKTGKIFVLGSYKGQKLIWKVINIQYNKALIICSDIIDTMPYHQFGENVTWNDCTLRKWLNNEFFNGSFNYMEKDRIILNNLNNENNPRYKTSGGVPTTDRVFLLSIYEANFYMRSNRVRANRSWWWLRSPGYSPNYASIVFTDGGIYENGRRVNETGGVCPAMWLRID